MKARVVRISEVRRYYVPYMKALEAFAYADFKFSDALDMIREWGFYVPDKEYEKRKIRKEVGRKSPTLVYDLMENKYDIMKQEASDLSSFFQFSPSQIQNLGLDPLLEWIQAGEDAEFTYDMTVMQSIISNIRNRAMRRAVCILSYQKKSPEEIWSILNSDSRAPSLKWSIEHIKFFVKFFWDTKYMTTNNWARYISMCDVSGDEEHFSYIGPMAKSAPDVLLTWHGGAYDRRDDLELIDLIISRQGEFALYSDNKEFSTRAGNYAINNIARKHKIISEMRLGGKDTDDPLKDVQLLIKKKGEEQVREQEEFATVEDIDGDVNDPKDIQADKNDYLEKN